LEGLQEAKSELFDHPQKQHEGNIGDHSVLPLIQKCLAKKLKLAVVISGSSSQAQAQLSSVGIDSDWFDVIVSDEALAMTAEDSNPLVQAVSTMNISAENCLVVDSTVAGVRAAKQAGLLCCGISSTEDRSDLMTAGADIVVNSISEISFDQPSKLFNPSHDHDTGSTVQDWLNTSIDLPGEWKTDRRSVLKVMNLGLATTCFYLLYSRSQALSVMSPRSVVKALNPFRKDAAMPVASGSRVEAFKRYIADVESKGGGSAVRDFPMGLDWFNAPPLSLQRDLRGKLIILDFWTYCCINCMHVLPDLAYIEKLFTNEAVAVVGVHSAKFDNEKDSFAIRNAVLRYNVGHPVVNDRNMVMWQNLGVSSWPTLIVLSPKGRVLFTLPGEGHRQDLCDLLSAGLEYYKPRGLLDYRPIPTALESSKDDRLLASKLRYPGKIATDIQGDRLFISDSNNNRIVITTLSGQFIDHVGGNGTKLVDGDYETCCFNRPQGVCFDADRNALFVADTENHALRLIDLGSKMVQTLAGNGYQGRDYKGGAKGKLQQLSSPWDVEISPLGSSVFVAMAGQHQIWEYNCSTQVMKAFSGNGYESNRNGSNSQGTSWAQPSGLSLLPNDEGMIVADSESSSIRKLDLKTGGSKGIAGGDPLFAENLFRFGDEDGRLSQALLQHPLGVLATSDNKIYIADSYNHKVKMCDLESSVVKTVCGSGIAGYSDGSGNKSRLSEPGGIAIGSDNTLFVADTNNNVIRVLNCSTESLTTLDLKGVPQARVSPLLADIDLDAATPSKVLVADEAVTENGTIDVNVEFSKGYDFTKGATSSFVAHVAGDGNAEIQLDKDRGTINPKRLPSIRVHYTSKDHSPGNAKILIDSKIYYCEEGKECLLEDVRCEIPLATRLVEGDSTVSVSVPVAFAG